MTLRKTSFFAMAAAFLVIGGMSCATAQTQEPSSGSQRNGSPPTLSPSQTDPSSGAIKPGPGLNDRNLDEQPTGSTPPRDGKALDRNCLPREPLNSLDAIPRDPGTRC